jgi:hypothetical protein
VTGAQEAKRAEVERRLRQRFAINLRFACADDDDRLVVWARLPGRDERRRLEPSLPWRVFATRSADEVVEIAGAIVATALAGATTS